MNNQFIESNLTPEQRMLHDYVESLRIESNSLEQKKLDALKVTEDAVAKLAKINTDTEEASVNLAAIRRKAAEEADMRNVALDTREADLNVRETHCELMDKQNKEDAEQNKVEHARYQEMIVVLDSQRNEVAVRERSMQVREVAVTTRESQLDSREKDVRARELAADRRESALQAEADTIAQREAESVAREKESITVNAKQDIEWNKLHETKRIQEIGQKSIEEEKSRLATREATLEAALDALESEKQRVATKDSECDRRSRTLDTRDLELKLIEKDLRAREKQVAIKEELLK